MPEYRRFRTSLCRRLFSGYYAWYLENRETLEKIHLVVDYSQMIDVPFLESYATKTLHPLYNTEIHQVILNLSPEAIRGFGDTEYGIYFDARFGGVDQHVVVPWAAFMQAFVLDENNTGQAPMGFSGFPPYEYEAVKDEPTPPTPIGRPSLSVVK
jgi:stringent starvation protein B